MSQPSKQERPTTGDIQEVACHSPILIGGSGGHAVKSSPPGGGCRVEEGWLFWRDPDGRKLLVSHKTMPGCWTEVPMGEVRYIRYAIDPAMLAKKA